MSIDIPYNSSMKAKSGLFPETSKERLFLRVEYPEAPECAPDEAIYWEPDFLHVYYEDINGKEDRWTVQKGEHSDGYPAYYPKQNLLMSEYWFKRFLNQEEDALIDWNKKQFKDISKKMIESEKDIDRFQKVDTEVSQALSVEKTQMEAFKGKMVSWLRGNKVNIAEIIDIPPPYKDDSEKLNFGYTYTEWNPMRKMDKIRHMAQLARNDEENSSLYWRKKFREQFPEGYSVELGRMRYENPRGEKFAINGLAFYKG